MQSGVRQLGLRGLDLRGGDGLRADGGLRADDCLRADDGLRAGAGLRLDNGLGDTWRCSGVGDVSETDDEGEAGKRRGVCLR